MAAVDAVTRVFTAGLISADASCFALSTAVRVVRAVAFSLPLLSVGIVLVARVTRRVCVQKINKHVEGLRDNTHWDI